MDGVRIQLPPVRMGLIGMAIPGMPSKAQRRSSRSVPSGNRRTVGQLAAPTVTRRSRTGSLDAVTRTTPPVRDTDAVAAVGTSARTFAAACRMTSSRS